MNPQFPPPDRMHLSSALHRRAWDLLCWVAAGTAGESDRLLVEAHLVDCAECREELAFQQQLRKALQQGAAEPGDAEAPLRRLMARIDAGPPLATGRPPSAAPTWTRWLAAAVLIQAVGLTVVGAALWKKTERVDPADYRTLSNMPAAGAAAVVRLVPAGDMDFASLRALLARHRLVIVEASSDGSSFGLALAHAKADARPAASSSEDRLLLQRLRVEPGVRMAEPIKP